MVLDKNKYTNIILNTTNEVNQRLQILVRGYRAVPVQETFKELDLIIERLRETKRAILYLRNVEGQA